MNYPHQHRRIKMWLLMISCFSFIKTSLAEECRTCENGHCDIFNLDECLCEREVTADTEQQWDRWRGEYVDVRISISRVIVECARFKEPYTALSRNTCPETVCKSIKFTSSNISTIPINFFKGTPHLEEIHLKSSGVRHLQVGAFSSLSKLTTLELDHNQMKEIRAGCFHTLSNLESLDLNSNEIETIDQEAFLGLTSLSYLDLSGNQLKSISTEHLSPLVNLKDLHLSRNFLTTVDFKLEKLKELQSIYLNHNEIEIIKECFSNTNLDVLFLQQNKIEKIDGTCLPYTITNLNIAYNNVTDLTFLNYRNSLTSLNVSNNKIEEMPVDTFEKSENLLNVDLSHNDLNQLKMGIFSRANQIQFLNLSSTKLKMFNSQVLIPLSNLRILDISGNNLNHWDTQTFTHFDSLSDFFLQGNNFSCDVASSIFLQAKLKNFSVVHDTDYSVENIKGLPCGHAEIGEQQNSTDAKIDHTISLYFGELTKYIDRVTDLLRKNLQNNLTAQISEIKTTDQEIPEKIVTSLRSEIIEQNNITRSELISFHDILHDTLYKKIVVPTNASPIQSKVIQYQDKSWNDSLIKMEQKMHYSLNHLKILMISGFTILTCVFVIIKISSYCFVSRKKNRGFDLIGQELPIISN